MTAVRDERWRLCEIPRIADHRGNLSFVESGKHVPFEIQRMFYVYDIPTGEYRGAHAHRELHQFVVCLSGSLDVRLDDGAHKGTVHLNRPWIGLHIPPMVWAEQDNFSPGTVYVVLASAPYDEGDYLREYDSFSKALASQGG